MSQTLEESNGHSSLHFYASLTHVVTRLEHPPLAVGSALNNVRFSFPTGPQTTHTQSHFNARDSVPNFIPLIASADRVILYSLINN